MNNLFKDLKQGLLKKDLTKEEKAELKACKNIKDLQYMDLYEDCAYMSTKIVDSGRENQYRLYKNIGNEVDFSDYEYKEVSLLGVIFYLNSENTLITRYTFKNAIDDTYYIQNEIELFCEETGVDDCDVTVHYNKNSGTGNYYYFRITTLDLDYTSEYLDVLEHRELLAHAIF